MPSNQSRPERRLWWAISLLTLGVFLLRWQQIPLYPLQDDELITLGLAKTIGEAGLPLTDVGQLYWRSIFGNYLVVFPALFAEPTLYTVRLVPILCSVLLFPVIYLFGREADAVWPSVLTCGFLAVSSFENLQANFARFYMPFQLFFVASVIAAWLFFQTDDRKWGYALTISLFGAIGSHQFAVQLLPVLLLAWLFTGRRAVWQTQGFIAAAVFLGAWSAICWGWAPPDVHTGSMALSLEVSGLGDKLAFWRQFRDFTPFGWTLALMGGVLLFVERKPLNLYCCLAFLISFAGVSLVAPADNSRYAAHLYPLFVLVAFLGVFSLAREIRRLSHQSRNSWITFFIIGVLTVSYAVATENLAAGKAFGVSVHYPDQAPAHNFLKNNLKAQDKIISLDPGITEYYLGRQVDFWLREYFDRQTQRYQPFPEQEKRKEISYYLDSPQRLEALLMQTRENLWLYANWKILWAVSPETDALIKSNFRPMFVSGETYVLLRPSTGWP